VPRQVFKRFYGKTQRRQGRNADVFNEYRLCRRRAASHAVHHDHVGAGMHRELHIVKSPSRVHFWSLMLTVPKNLVNTNRKLFFLLGN